MTEDIMAQQQQPVPAQPPEKKPEPAPEKKPESEVPPQGQDSTGK